MLLWVGFAVLTAAVMAALLHPLLRPSPADVATADAATSHDGAIYRDQLTEIDADRERGLITPSEALTARAEIARRLIGAEDQAARHATALGTRLDPRTLAMVLLALLPLVALSLYGLFGSPAAPGQPIASRTQPAPTGNAEIDRLVAAVEQRLKSHPEDAEGWDVIAPVYLRMGRYLEAADAFARAIRLKGESSQRVAGLAESTVLAADGIVTEAARAAYEKLASLEPVRPEPKFWLALAKEQDGRLKEALEAYRGLLRDGDPHATWRQLVEERAADVAAKLGVPPDLPKLSTLAPAARDNVAKVPDVARGPSAEDMAAADKLSAADRQRMIDDMVQGLSARLDKDGRDLAGWQRLIRAYVVMGRKPDAVAALGRARGYFTSEPQSLSALKDLAKALGLES